MQVYNEWTNGDFGPIINDPLQLSECLCFASQESPSLPDVRNAMPDITSSLELFLDISYAVIIQQWVSCYVLAS